jgi:hypothetical protein
MALDPRVVEARIHLRVAELRLLAAQTAVEFFANGQTVRGLPPPSEADDGRTPTTDLQSNNHCPAKTHNVELVTGRSFYRTNTTPGPILNPAIAPLSRE